MPKTSKIPRPTSPEEWEALFLGPRPVDRTATRTDADIAADLGLSRQAIGKRRTDLGIGACPVLVEIETPPPDATLREIAGWRIRLHRVRLGWTSSTLARELGGSWIRSAVACVELARTGPGRRGLTIETLQQFAEALDVSPADLLLRPGQRGTDVPPRPARHVEVTAHHRLTAVAERAAEDWKALAKLKPAPPLMRVAGVNIIRWRCARGMSQTELEELVSGREDHSRISDVERASRHALTLETLDAFASALGCTPADLVRLPRQPPMVPVETG